MFIEKDCGVKNKVSKKTQNIVYQENVLNQSVNVISKFRNIGRQDSEHGYYYRPHIHEEFEFIYIIQGKIKAKINGVDIEAKKGDVYFVQPGQQHEEFSESEFVSFYYIKCFIHRLDSKVAYITSDINNQKFTPKGTNFKRIFDSIFEEVSKKNIGYWQVVEAQTMELICNVLRMFSKPNTFNYLKEESLKPAFNNRIINDAVEVIKVNERRFLSVKELADKVSVSESYLYAIFKKHLNVSPEKYMMEIKMDQAKLMLVNTDMSVKNIANYYGFDDSHFSKVFKKMFDVTPLEYRKDFIKEKYHENNSL